ncbi:MAG TPA: DUF3618 domain-containing protein [Marmoricola sp.]
MTHLGQHNGTTSSDPAELEREIARQRAQLADTVDALSHKLDVKHRAQEAAEQKVAHLKAATTTASGKPRPDLLAAGAALAAAVALLLWWRNRS